MSTTQANETYAQWLRREMDERGLTTRELARRWKPDDFETARRAVRRYLKGMVPLQRTRQEIAVALGSEETGPSGADDAEGD